MSIPEFNEIVEQNDQTAARAEHLAALIELVGNAYPNKFDRSSITGGDDTITAIKRHQPVTDVEHEMGIVKENLAEGERPPADIKDSFNERLLALGRVRIAGRLTTPPRGNFVHLTDGMSKLQIYCKKGQFAVGTQAASLRVTSPTLDAADSWTVWQLIDHGDFVGVEGYLFVTNTGEVSVHVEKLQFLAKAMLPMPDKMHGIEDAEIKQRQRYVDLIGSSLRAEPPASAGGARVPDGDAVGQREASGEAIPPAHAGGSALSTREVFELRAKVISSLRRFLEDHGYVEVETPMLTAKATGAAAKPFKTHHNALDIDLYARIAPELYLKRLVVGGFEKVYELNRNFRNEGISYKHNPEFTMLEFYCAYMNVDGMMDFCEEMLRESVQKATGGMVVEYEGKRIDFGKFERISMRDAIAKFAPNVEVDDNNIIAAFDEYVEPNLIQPTFILDFPKAISPLSKASPENPAVAERFELFINGMEVANGFSELNDPREQYDRFIDQMAERERGDDEAMVLDEDYVRALSYGMPPAAGIGIGIDRLVMLLTNKHSIRDVILFPHMRPERKLATEDTESTEDE
ncbi:MAG: lysine--tRNA ligase [Pyrinomonadaceae bacterium]|nr:lysine--tRNA ligase [Pyrinomonadaceae bacterium]